jgi:acyl phosphate:glycerol-3-phosphate acyltransferase
VETGIFNVILVCLLCYIAGSFPTAYLVVKILHNKDITAEGSGNVGMLNSLQVTKSKSVGIFVLIVDILKGLLPVYFMLFVFRIDYKIAMAGSACLVLGHNYPVWLKFKGGRGLATGTGIFIGLNYFILLGWCIAWVISFALKRNVLISNTAATVLIPFYVFLVNIVSFLEISWGLNTYSLKYFTVFSIIITIIVLSKHTEIFKKNN